MDYKNSNKLLFVLASPAGSGYRVGRVVSCFNNVHWYMTKRNGKNPWSIFFSDLVKGKDISPYHYDRRTETNMIPLAGERIECYWNKQDLDTFYNTAWTNAMTAAGADNIINNNMYINWVLHDTPEYILSLFPNAKIINLVDTDVNSVITRYMDTTALFPVTIENKDLKPLYLTEYAASLDELSKLNTNPTYRDFWAWNYFKEPEYQDTMYAEYFSYVNDLINSLHKEKSKKSPDYINVSLPDLDIRSIQKFLNSESIDQNVSALLT
jgi:hypothetical protein